MTRLCLLTLTAALLLAACCSQAHARSWNTAQASCHHRAAGACDSVSLLFRRASDTKTPPVKPGSSAKLCLLDNCVSVRFIHEKGANAFIAAHIFRSVGPYRCGSRAKLTISYWSQSRQGAWVTSRSRPRLACL